MVMDVYSSLSVSRGLGKIRNFEYMVDKVGENHCPLVGKVNLFERNTVHYLGHKCYLSYPLLGKEMDFLNHNLGKIRILGKNIHPW